MRSNQEVPEVAEDESEPLEFDVGDDYQEAVSFHRWFAMRGPGAARAAVAFATSPDWLRVPEKIALVAAGDDAALAAAVAARQPGRAGASRGNEGEPLLDLCAGVGTVGAMAARLGFAALSLELSDIPHLISQVLYDFAVSLGSADERGSAGSWRGYAIEVEEFADAVWRDTKERLSDLFEPDVDIRVWARYTECPFCGAQVPVVGNARISADVALDVAPGPGRAGDRDSEMPRFSIRRTEFPDVKGTLAKGSCTCTNCGNRFPFHGHDLVSLRAVPVAVRAGNSTTLNGVKSPGAYVRRTAAESFDALAASSRRLGGRVVLPGRQPVFQDISRDPVIARDAFLPRQRAYFAALAESVSNESVLLAKRTTLTEAQRTAVRVAVALLISSQADYVNTCVHLSIDRRHSSALAPPLQLGGLFTEVGGFWLERFWQTRLSHLLGLLRANSLLSRPVRSIKADANAVPLSDAAVSTVIWDPPYYDDVDYETAAGHYQSILAAVIPDVVDEPAVALRLTRAERAARHQGDLVRQASEARRVLKPGGSIGVFWLVRERSELTSFLELIAPAEVHLVQAVRLDTIRPLRAGSAGPQTYLLVLQPAARPSAEVTVDAEQVLSLAADGALSLYDGLAELLESVLESHELDELIADERSDAARPRLAGFLASQPELEPLLIELGRASLLRELGQRGISRGDLRTVDTPGLAQRLLALLGFAVARPARFSIRQALRECGSAGRRLELADSAAAVNEALLDGFNHVERVLKYTAYSWSYLERGDDWPPLFEQVISSAKMTYTPDRLSFGHHHALFTRLPELFAQNGNEQDRELFARIAKEFKAVKVNHKLNELVRWRNKVGHQRPDVLSLSVRQLRENCSKTLADACAVLAGLYDKRFLPVTVQPEEERRDRYNRRVLRLLDSDDTPVEVYVASETDLTEPLIYIASGDSGPRDISPRFLRASVVEALCGLAGRDSDPGPAQPGPARLPK